jgi:hypothetical protein
MTRQHSTPAILFLALGLGSLACASGSNGDYGAFGATVGAAGDDGPATGGADGADDAGDKPDGDGPGSGPVDGGDDAPPPLPDDGGGAAGDCCEGHGGMGCADAAIAACVCAQDSFCCDNSWDGTCVQLIESLGCGACGGADGPSDGSGGPGDTGGAGDTGAGGGSGGGGGGGGAGAGVGDCCAPNGSVGCNDAAIQACVCAADSYCCDTDWDSLCVEQVDTEGCGMCGGGGGGGGTTTGVTSVGTSGGGGGGGMGDCCTPNGSPGCDDPGVESCVCAADAFCCGTEWDQLCVDQVDSLGCGSCGGGTTGAGGTTGGGGMAACCMVTMTPGCPADPTLEACVCAGDAFCCTNEWDQFCVDEVDAFGCGSC